MNLLLDVGNSRIKWRWEGPAGRQPARTAPHATANDDIVADGRSPDQIGLAASGNEAWVDSFLATARNCWPAAGVRRAVTAARTGALINSYHEPQTMGVDRWLAMLAARESDLDVLVIDAGTAITCDWIGHDGRHRGGWIVPGPALMRKSLGQDTARVGEHAPDGDVGEFGQSTAACVVAGTEQAAAAIVTRAAMLVRNSAPRCKIVVTGGDAALALAGASLPNVEHVPELVLDGLSLWLAMEENTPS